MQFKDKDSPTHPAWVALGNSASQLLAVSSGLTYIGPAFTLLSLAIRQFATFTAVPKEATEMLRCCYYLLLDINNAWPQIAKANAQQDERVQRWLKLLARAAAECLMIVDQQVVVRQVSTDRFCMPSLQCRTLALCSQRLM